MINIENAMSKFELEFIDNDQKLFYRIHKTNIDNDINDDKLKIKPAAFDPMPRPTSVEMSVNWQKYSSPTETKNSARKPENVGVLSFLTLKVRISPVNLKVTHAPTINQAHSHIHEVVSEVNDPQIRLKLRNICEWEIHI